MRSTPLRVAVSGIHLGENAQPGPGVIRSLRVALGRDVEIVGLAYDALDSSLYVPGLLDDAWLLPYPSAGPEAYLERLLDIQKHGGLDVLVPCLDVELPVLMRLERRLADLGVAMALPSAASLSRRGKERIPELAAAVGLQTPPTRTVLDLPSVEAAGVAYGYPMVVKGPFYEAEIVAGPAEAAAAFGKLSARWGLPLLAQRFVRGEEYDVVALGDGEGGMAGAVAMRKTVITRQGKAWGAVTILDGELLDAARRLVAELRWRGGCELELMRETATGALHLIEVNPRFPAWVYLATAAGSNLPLGLLRLARGERVPRLDAYRPGVCYVRHAAEAIGELEDVEALVSRGRARRPELHPPLPHAPAWEPLREVTHA